MIHVLRPGMLSTVQDLGRTGFQKFGVVAGGAADPFAVRVANHLTGNEPGAAVIEMALAGPRLHFDRETLVAWCGADFAVTLDGRPLSKNRPVLVRTESVIDFTGARRGAMAWLAASGGITVPEVMGSRSTDTGARIGGHEGRALAAGDELPTGEPSAWAQAMMTQLRTSGRDAAWSLVPESLGKPNGQGMLRVVRGPEWEWFAPAAQERFTSAIYGVSKDSNRMGVRLEGPPLDLEAPRDMISSAVQHGVVQVPSSGQPIVLGADRQTLGGYPRIGAVATADIGKLAQLRPGEPVRFREIPQAVAHALLIERERDLAIAIGHLSTPRL
ncbi:biotin-dependent carboxyltransferase family protein [Luteolibacter ambystomatis]|uniref:Biotin-dependent carboxyltransferase family protein n=1 Tax=Luteolibacter ambystomatis TaxID=2824561 RepID=A0A975PFM7_9BACT|nr:biotin-dependent carboxyltransferase family protein [Luteolibacter ambystomatis]QUE52118.1 biotin-dependent carboxyltransferase family protein [Luteolibacter ambystomatis]